MPKITLIDVFKFQQQLSNWEAKWVQKDNWSVLKINMSYKATQLTFIIKSGNYLLDRCNACKRELSNSMLHILWNHRLAHVIRGPFKLIRPHKIEKFGGPRFLGRQVAWSPAGDWCVVAGSQNTVIILQRWPKGGRHSSSRQNSHVPSEVPSRQGTAAVSTGLSAGRASTLSAQPEAAMWESIIHATKEITRCLAR